MRFFNIDIRKLIESPLLKIPLILLLGYYIGKTAVFPQPLLWLLALTIVLAIAVFKNPKLGIITLIIAIFLLDWLQKSYYFIPRQITWLKDVTLMLLIMRTLTLVVLKKEFRTTPIDLFLIAFLGVGLLSALLNAVPPVVAALGFRKPLKYILLFYIIVNSEFDEKFFKTMIKTLLIITFIQVPVAIFEYLIWTPDIAEVLGSGMGEFDFITGTLPRGSSGAFALFLLSMICILLGFSIYTKKSIFFWSSLLLLAPFLLTMSRFSFFLLPIVILFLLRKNLFFLLSRRLAYAAVLFIFFLITVQASSVIVRYDLKRYLLNPRRQLQRQAISIEETGESGRVASIKYVFDYLKKVPMGHFFGVGPGMWSESYFSQYTSKLYLGTSASHANQIAATMSEFGLLGVILFLLMIHRIYIKNNLFFSKVEDPFWKSVSFGFSGIILIFVLGGLYIPIWHSDVIAFYFWFIAGAIYTTGKKKSIF